MLDFYLTFRTTWDNYRKWRENAECRLFSRRTRFYLEYEDSSRSKRNNRPFFVPKVYTRNAHGIRGHVEAYVVAFDKFWNLALEDCFEVWSRKVKRKAPALGTIILLKFILWLFLFSSKICILILESVILELVISSTIFFKRIYFLKLFSSWNCCRTMKHWPFQ